MYSSRDALVYSLDEVVYCHDKRRLIKSDETNNEEGKAAPLSRKKVKDFQTGE